MVGENFEIYFSQIAKIAFKSTMIGENFEIFFRQIAKIVYFYHGCRKFWNLLQPNS